MTGRKPGFKHSEKTRTKIKTTQIVNLLQKHEQGKVDMKPSQVNAAKVLLDKTLPSLSMADIVQHTEDQTPEELYYKLSQLIGPDLANQMFPEFSETKH